MGLFSKLKKNLNLFNKKHNNAESFNNDTKISWKKDEQIGNAPGTKHLYTVEYGQQKITYKEELYRYVREFDSKQYQHDYWEIRNTNKRCDEYYDEKFDTQLHNFEYENSILNWDSKYYKYVANDHVCTNSYSLDDNSVTDLSKNKILASPLCDIISKTIITKSKNLTNEIEKLPCLFFNSHNYKTFYDYIKVQYNSEYNEYLKKGYEHSKIQEDLKLKYGLMKKTLDEKYAQCKILTEKMNEEIKILEEKAREQARIAEIERRKREQEEAERRRKEQETNKYIDDTFDKM